MRVLVISHLFPRPGAPELVPFIHRQVRELASRGVEITVVSPQPLLPPGIAASRRIQRTRRVYGSTPREWTNEGLRVVAPRYIKVPGLLDHGLFAPLYHLAVGGVIRRLHRQAPFDLLHAQMLVPDGYAAVKLGRRLGLPVVATERGYAAKQVAQHKHQRALAATISGATRIVTVSQAMARIVQSVCQPPQALRVVYTGFDPAEFPILDMSTSRATLGLPAGPLLLCVARLEQTKSPMDVAQALAGMTRAVPNVVLAWVGDGAMREEFSRYCLQLGIAESVRIAGNVPHGDMHRWYSAANVVLLASRNEGLPNSLVEAGGCGRPIVATSVGGIPEVVRDEETGVLVPPSNPRALGDALTELVRSPERAERMGRAGREFVLGRFSWQRHADEMLDIYREVSGRQ